jgi:hypothetical protein
LSGGMRASLTGCIAKVFAEDGHHLRTSCLPGRGRRCAAARPGGPFSAAASGAAILPAVTAARSLRGFCPKLYSPTPAPGLNTRARTSTASPCKHHGQTLETVLGSLGVAVSASPGRRVTRPSCCCRRSISPRASAVGWSADLSNSTTPARAADIVRPSHIVRRSVLTRLRRPCSSARRQRQPEREHLRSPEPRRPAPPTPQPKCCDVGETLRLYDANGRLRILRREGSQSRTCQPSVMSRWRSLSATRPRHSALLKSLPADYSGLGATLKRDVFRLRRCRPPAR